MIPWLLCTCQSLDIPGTRELKKVLKGEREQGPPPPPPPSPPAGSRNRLKSEVEEAKI